MERCNKIYNHPLYKEQLAKITHLERDRTFCLHNLEHALDVARIAYIKVMENGLNIEKELIYAAALLHDAGRYSGVPHNESGALLAQKIMPDCGFTDEETDIVSKSISGHRDTKHTDAFSQILYDADKKSRLCFTCVAQAECYWENEKRNHTIDV